MLQRAHVVKDLSEALVYSGFGEQVNCIKFGHEARYTEGVVVFISLHGIDVRPRVLEGFDRSLLKIEAEAGGIPCTTRVVESVIYSTCERAICVGRCALPGEPMCEGTNIDKAPFPSFDHAHGMQFLLCVYSCRRPLPERTEPAGLVLQDQCRWRMRWGGIKDRLGRNEWCRKGIEGRLRSRRYDLSIGGGGVIGLLVWR